MTCSKSICPIFTGGAVLEFEVELVNLAKKPYISMPQGNGFLTAAGIVVIAVIVIYEFYKRASRQGVELRDNKKREKENRKGGKGRKEKNKNK